MNKAEIKKDLDRSTTELLDILRNIPDTIFNTKPPGGGWTIGQVAEHLIKVETSAVRLFSGAVESPDRDPEKKIGEIRERFLDYDTKLKAFGPIVPDASAKDKVRALNKIQDIRQKLRSLVDIQDMTSEVRGFEHALFGYLTV